MHVNRTIATLGTVVAGCALALATAPAATAHSAPAHLAVTKTLSTGTYIGPLQFAVKDHTVLVADSFAATLNVLGRTAPVATFAGKGSDISGVAIGKHHSYAYTESNETHTATFLVIVGEHGTRKVNLAAFEKKYNPDRINHYGTTSHDPCVIEALTPPPGEVGAEGPPAQAKYRGQVDSHPYSVVAGKHGSWIVADAGGNDILKVDKWGKIHVVAVLPPQPRVLTADLAAQLAGPHAPACLIGTTYRYEPVPTDVEFTRWGQLYATTLGSVVPGNSSVYKIDRGHVHKIVGGLTTATNLAIDHHGNIFVAQLFAGLVSEVPRGSHTATVVAALPSVAAVEWANGKLYASTAPAALLEGAPSSGPPPFGTIVVLGPAHT